MQLDQILSDEYVSLVGLPFRKLKISSICTDSRKIKPGDIFVALQGLTHNGDEFISQAIHNGACVIVTGPDSQYANGLKDGICHLSVRDPLDFLHDTARRLFEDPSEKIRTIGITGTNGKTTVTYLIESVLIAANIKCGVIGTVNYRHGNLVAPSGQTTPDYVDNQKFLHTLVRDNIPYCLMEVSSHALMQGRTFGIEFCAGVFTNLTGDHMDYHKTREEYFAAKARLFTTLGQKSTAVINADDLYGRQLVKMTEAKITTYGIKRPADVMAKDVRLEISGSAFTVCLKAGEIQIRTRLIGIYNVYNILASVAVCLAEGISPDVIKAGIERMGVVPGRLERVACDHGYSIFIDYAHTQDALENVLTAMREVSRSKIILVFGCGGDRDRTKRRLMGQVAGHLADYAIVTSDNPRSEDPRAIIDEITPGFSKDNFEVIVDRRQAIERALAMAEKGDIVLIAGKGHETYQTFADRTVEFNERQIIEKYLSCSPSKP